MDPLTQISTRITPQTSAARAEQVPNNAGGHVFAIADVDRIRRFLTLGTEGTYYASAKDVTLDNAKVVLDWAAHRPKELVDLVVSISAAGRAPKNNPALLALAAAAGSEDWEGSRYALDNLNKVARTGTHLFLFAQYVQQFRGWGRGLRRAVGNWYESKSVEDLAYQLLKYRQRDGWTHRDLLRLSHPLSGSYIRNGLYQYATHGTHELGYPGGLVDAFEAAKDASIPELVDLIKMFPLSWEMLPTAALDSIAVWIALIAKGMPLTALMRQLPRLTRLGVFKHTDTLRRVVVDLTSPAKLAKARIHPVNVLVAQRTYASGRSARGDGEWTPDRHITDALDAAFYAAFGTVEPAGKRTLIGLDVSGSMGAQISGLPISAREASAALALVQLATEPDADIVGFTGGRIGGFGNIGQWVSPYGYQGNTPPPAAYGPLTELNISPRQRLDDVVRYVSGLPFGTTDCALPMTWALEQGRQYDTFVIYTDNETYAGLIHPFQALKRYRERTGIDAKLIVVGMTSTGFSIADPSDPGMLDVAGFDSAVPNLISDFSRGDV
jgi:60 kDa SS-A/Ro ribonucleoprotein